MRNSGKNDDVKRQLGLKGFGLAVVGLSFLVACVFGMSSIAEDGPLYKKPDAPVEQRIEDLLGRMTLEEKIQMIHGTGMDTEPIARLGIPGLSMTDGPHGVRWGRATAFPPGVNMGSTWNEPLLEKVGAAIARETLARGRNVILGPCINIHRVPFGGRNFESFSEDPYLAGRLAVGYVKGVQSQNVVATPKHYAVNNQEWERNTISAEIGERALREIYLPHFRAAIVEGGAWSIMCSYNRLNGTYACENRHLMTGILKDDWGFEGFAMSDWGAAHSTLGNALNGLDVEMPHGTYMGKKLLEAVKNGEVPEPVVDDKVRRILRVMFVSGLFDGKIEVDENWLDSPGHRAIALEVARESITLLKNEGGVLPLDRKKIRSIAVIGPNATAARLGGGGSSTVTPFRSIAPLDGIKALVGDGVEVRHAMGCDLHVPVKFEIIPPEYLKPAEGGEGGPGLLGEYFEGDDFKSEPVATRVDARVSFDFVSTNLPEGLKRDRFSARWTGKLIPPETGKYKLVAISNDGTTRLLVNGRQKLSTWSLNGVHHAKSAKVKLKAGEEYDIRFNFNSIGVRSMVKLGWVLPGSDPIADAAKLAGESDAAVVFVGLDSGLEGEGHDRDGMEMPGLQNDLVEAVVAANPNTAVVLVNGTPVVMDSWADSAPAIVEAWYPGQEGGTAIAEILFGDVNPSGRLPVTLPHSWEECPAHGNYPGKDGKVHYEEGIFLGYRYYDTKDVEPLFPFGHGLSYTEFEYGGLKIQPEKMGRAGAVEVSLTVKNTGARAGKEVVQLYVRDVESSVERPAKELKGIRKVGLEPGESKSVTFKIDRSALSFYDEGEKKWVAEPGAFEAQVGGSSRDIRLRGGFALE